MSKFAVNNSSKKARSSELFYSFPLHHIPVKLFFSLCFQEENVSAIENLKNQVETHLVYLLQ